ncbi:FAD-dependent oxidoreductase [Acidithiobacillus sp. IBUN Pt1247-S3]|uniref:FAD-dependent oxidoreductase n=1 Tax=Acidithiobacillus sp. IBUN Pt1247-S3 TaxID=3166642 RepID=UPI0034E5674C
MMERHALTEATVAERFRGMEARLPEIDVPVEAERCFYCYDAPCTRSCPAAIDIPAFIRALALGQPARAASIILRENPLGMSCARVCPVETLCEEICVRASDAGGPVRIGLLQRAAMSECAPKAATPVPVTNTRVAVVGAGPAGMTVARLLAEAGVQVSVLDAGDRPGGLNETGIAAYKMLDDAAQKEATWLLDHPHIMFRGQMALGNDVTLASLREQYHAVVLAMGLAGQRRLAIPGEDLPGVAAAVPFIAAMRRGEAVAVGKKVLVIGGGMTAIDIAIQIRLLGAEEVHICYRRGIGDMGASAHERQLAREQGVLIHPGLRPLEIREAAGGGLDALMQSLREEDGKWIASGKSEFWHADQIFTAIGQGLDRSAWRGDAELMSLALDAQGKIAVDDAGHTNLPGVWAAGDCAGRSSDLTVHAVADGKRVVDAILAARKQEAA